MSFVSRLLSYSSSPACASYITSDCGAVSDVMKSHGYVNDTASTVTAVLTAGMDTDCGSFMDQQTVAGLLANGTLDVALVDAALSHLYRVQASRFCFGFVLLVLCWTRAPVRFCF